MTLFLATKLALRAVVAAAAGVEVYFLVVRRIWMDQSSSRVDTKLMRRARKGDAKLTCTTH